MIQKLDALLLVLDASFSPLQQLKEPPQQASATAMTRLTDKLARIEETGVLEVDLSWLNNNYQRALASYVRTCTAHRLREVELNHRYGELVCFLRQTYQDTIDFIIDMHAKLINKVEKKAKETFDLQLLQRRKSINESLCMFQTVGKIVLDESVSDDKVRSTIFSKVLREDLAQQIVQLSLWEKEKPKHLFTCVVNQFNYLRKFSPAFLKYLEFEHSPERAVHEVTAERSEHTSLLNATSLLKEMNALGCSIMKVTFS